MNALTHPGRSSARLTRLNPLSSPPCAAFQARHFLDFLLFPDAKREQQTKSAKETTVIVGRSNAWGHHFESANSEVVVGTASSARPRMREIEPDEEAEFEDLEPRVEERNGMVGKVSSRVAGWLYSDGEPAAPRPNVEYRETGRRSGQRDGRNEPDEDINPSNNGFANPFARFSAKADSTTTSAPFSPHAAVAKARLTATNAMAAAAKMDRLVREFPESFATQPADPFAPSAVVPRNPNAPDPASSPNPVKPIPEAKLRRFLIREAQQDRPDSHLNPALPPKTPVASRQFLSNNVPTMLAGKSASARARVGQKVRLQHALQDAERYKQPTEQLWNEYFSVGVKGATGWQALVEERIEQARREGQFENLPGAGERIKYLEDDPAARNPFLDNVEYHLNKSIKAQGLRPPFVEASIEIDAEVASIRQSLKTLHKSEGTRYDSFARTHVELRIKEVNERIRGYNMTIPKGIPKKMPLELSRELERGKETEVGRKRRQRIEELAMDEAMKRFFDNL